MSKKPYFVSAVIIREEATTDVNGLIFSKKKKSISKASKCICKVHKCEPDEITNLKVIKLKSLN